MLPAAGVTDGRAGDEIAPVLRLVCCSRVAVTMLPVVPAVDGP